MILGGFGASLREGMATAKCGGGACITAAQEAGGSQGQSHVWLFFFLTCLHLYQLGPTFEGSTTSF